MSAPTEPKFKGYFTDIEGGVEWRVEVETWIGSGWSLPVVVDTGKTDSRARALTYAQQAKITWLEKQRDAEVVEDAVEL